MNLYSNKQRWKIALLFVAMTIVGVTVWYSNFITTKIRNEEHQKVELWSEAIQRRAELVKFTQQLFENLKSAERERADLLAEGYKIVSDPNDESNLTFVLKYLWSNTNIPILIYNNAGEFQLQANIAEDKLENKTYLDSLKTEMERKNPPIVLQGVDQLVYYDDSRLFSELQDVMDDLINSFISETVINSASVPVILTDSTRTKVISSGNIDISEIGSSAQLEQKLSNMAQDNVPIEIELPNQGVNYIYFQDSLVVNLLSYYPLVQLILVGVFLLVSYLIFSTFRKAEQNQVWVGMAKETAHQLGTPLSSLMAWMSIIETQGVPKETIVEISKDLERLTMITDRFSKIGSTPDLEEEDMVENITQAMHYLQRRVSKRVHISIEPQEKAIYAKISRPLFAWVLENLIKNAVDAMEGEGNITARILREGKDVVVEIEDDGKGIPRNQQRTVFQPGFTTKKRGWGLGLSLTKRIIENYHDGKIFVKSSEVGKGTIFKIVLKSA